MSTRTTKVHADGRVTGQVEVQDGRGRPMVIEFETEWHPEPMSADTLTAWENLAWGKIPYERVEEARRLVAARKNTTSAA